MNRATLDPVLKAAIDAAAETWGQPASSTHAQVFAMKKADVFNETAEYARRFQEAEGRSATFEELVTAALAIHRAPGRPWGMGRDLRVTDEAFPRYRAAASTIAERLYPRDRPIQTRTAGP